MPDRSYGPQLAARASMPESCWTVIALPDIASSLGGLWLACAATAGCWRQWQVGSPPCPPQEGMQRMRKSAMEETCWREARRRESRLYTELDTGVRVRTLGARVLCGMQALREPSVIQVAHGE